MNPANNPRPNPIQGNQPQVNTPEILRNIEGGIRTVIINPVVAPIYTPKNLSLQLEIRMDLKISPTVKRLYVYSFETKIWSYITLT